MGLTVWPVLAPERPPADWWDDDDAEPCGVCRWVTRHHIDCHRVLDVDDEVLEAD